MYGAERRVWVSKRLVSSGDVCCTSFSNQHFALPVYLKIDFLNGCAYDDVFDTVDVSPSLSRREEGRLMYAFYGAAPGLKVSGRKLKYIPHEEAIRHIVETILQRTTP